MLTKAKAFIQDQFYKIEKELEEQDRCMDERYPKIPAHIALPGAGIGALLNMIAAYEAFVKRDATLEELEVIWNIVFKILRISFHRGCGYIDDTLQGLTNVSSFSGNFVKGKMEKHIECGYVPVSFPDKHNASFVFFVMTNEYGINPTHSSGIRGYVIHLLKYQQNTENITAAVSAHFGIDNAELLSLTNELATAHLGKVVKKLGADKIPHFEVYAKDDIRQVHTPVEENAEVV